ncbi:MAG TPA: Uma2 family endonuclease [Thermoanaerobaculia bacterium]|nr:Uma2 family endonuclease [Thermoanaerobaculia bacterium]
MTVATETTADELLQLPDDGWRYELVRGELRKMSPSGARHSAMGMRIGAKLTAYVLDRKLGEVYGADGGFRLSRKPDTVLAADVAFVRAERFVDTPKFFDGPPDLAIEVVSPNDTDTEIAEKTLEWLRGGTRVVVIVDPRTHSVHVHRESGAIRVNDVLEIEDVVPGWRLPLAELFA